MLLADRYAKCGGFSGIRLCFAEHVHSTSNPRLYVTDTEISRYCRRDRRSDRCCGPLNVMVTLVFAQFITGSEPPCPSNKGGNICTFMVCPGLKKPLTFNMFGVVDASGLPHETWPLIFSTVIVSGALDTLMFVEGSV